MTNKPDGGPAFPVSPALEIIRGEKQIVHGMSLRDYFAAAALTRTYVPMEAYPPDLMRLAETRDTYAHEVAAEAYRIADAMLAERDRQ